MKVFNLVFLYAYLKLDALRFAIEYSLKRRMI